MRKQELHPRTAIINKKQKIQSKIARHDALAWLAVKFPEAFDNSVRIQPLKAGIMADILAEADNAMVAGISISKLREAVVVFTRRIDYLTALKAREMRIDLHGNPVNQVTEEDAERAAAKIKKRVEKSAKNARKNLTGKSAPQSNQRAAYLPKPQEEQVFTPHYPERATAFGSQNSTVPATRATPVIIKHKSARTYDPDAVARLKERLGLSRKTHTNEETTE